jgi:hypothetical protein
VPLRELASNARPGDRIGVNFRVFLRGKLVSLGQAAATLPADAVARFKLTGFRPAKRSTYVIRIEANTVNGGVATRELTVVAV